MEYFPRIDSTNAEALRRLQQGKTEASLLLAGQQDAGRGRRGRDWQSPAGQGIYMSLLWPLSTPAERLPSLSLVTAISLHEALRSFGAQDVFLKWPNDILHNNRKLAGILLELHRGEPVNHVVFGIGLNLDLSDETLAGIENPATDLKSVITRIPSTEEVIAMTMDKLFCNLERFGRKGFEEFLEYWNQHDFLIGEDVEVIDGRQRSSGRSLGVDDRGALRLCTAAGERSFGSGELAPSLRAAGVSR